MIAGIEQAKFLKWFQICFSIDVGIIDSEASMQQHVSVHFWSVESHPQICSRGPGAARNFLISQRDNATTSIWTLLSHSV